MTPAEKLERARSVCAEVGVPLTVLNTLAVDINTAGLLLRVSRSTVKRLIAASEIASFKVGHSTRIELTELVDFIGRNRTSVGAWTNPSVRARAIALLDDSDV